MKKVYKKIAQYLFLILCALNARIALSQVEEQQYIRSGPTGTFIVPEPTSRDCKEHERCVTEDGQAGICDQTYCGVGLKCFICRPGTGPGST